MEINNIIQLEEAIALLKARQEEKKFMLVEQFHSTYNSLKPVNLIKQAFNNIIKAPDTTKNVIGTTIGLGAAVLSKKILVGKSTNLFKRVFGAIIEVAVVNAVAKNSGPIKQQGLQLIKKWIK